MVEMILLGLLGGVFLSLNRVFITRLSLKNGAIRSSMVNHIGGFLFLAIIVSFQFDKEIFSDLLKAPFFAYWGGAIGVIFVAINTWLVVKIGVMKTTIFVISGQIFFSTIIDWSLGNVQSPLMALLGMILIIFGVVLAKLFNYSSRDRKSS